jgi:Tfp pilus assembly protein PilF
MKMKILRAMAIACLPLFAASVAVATAPASAAEKNTPQPSSDLKKPLGEAYKLLQAKDWTNAIAKLKECEPKISTDYDKYLVYTFLAISYNNLGDVKSAADAFAHAAEAKDIPESDRQETIRKAIQINKDAQNFAKAIEIAKANYNFNGPVEEAISALVSECYYFQNDFSNAAVYAQKAIDAATAAGRIPNQKNFVILLNSQGQSKNLAGQIVTLESLVRYYGSPEDWSKLILVSLDEVSRAKVDKSAVANKSKDVASLFLLRLELVANPEMPTDDYLDAAVLADGLRFYGETVRFLNAGKAKGLNNPNASRLLSVAAGDAKNDEATLAQAESVAAKGATAALDVSVAEDYFGYGRYADAERVVNRAIGKGGVKKLEALLLLGAIQAIQGKNDAAAASFNQVKGDPALEVAAKAWNIYATRKYGQTPPAPAAK